MKFNGEVDKVVWTTCSESDKTSSVNSDSALWSFHGAMVAYIVCPEYNSHCKSSKPSFVINMALYKPAAITKTTIYPQYGSLYESSKPFHPQSYHKITFTKTTVYPQYGSLYESSRLFHRQNSTDKNSTRTLVRPRAAHCGNFFYVCPNLFDK